MNAKENPPGGVVFVNDLAVYYHRRGKGSGSSSIVLLHGYTGNGLTWSRAAQDMEDRYDVIMPDARGHGATHGPVKDMSIHLLAQDAAGLIRALGLEKPILFGHSMGAMTALAVAADYPELVRAAVLEDPPMRAAAPYVLTPEEREKLEQDGKADLLLHDLPLAERITEGRARHPKWDESEIVPWAQSRGQFHPEIINHRAAFRSYAWRKALERVLCPVLLVIGDPDQGAITTPVVAEEAAKICRTLEVARIAGAGHNIHRDKYEDTMRAVEEFLA